MTRLPTTTRYAILSLVAAGIMVLCAWLGARPLPAAPRFEPSSALPALAWRRVLRVEGHGAPRYRPCRITADRWLIRWHLNRRADVNESYLRIRVIPPIAHPDNFYADVDHSSDGAIYLRGAAPYYLDIQSHQDYTITVEEARNEEQN